MINAAAAMKAARATKVAYRFHPACGLRVASIMTISDQWVVLLV
jgi:hypothetical protein